MPTHTFTEMAGTSRLSTCATPPNIPPTWRSDSSTVSSQQATSQFTRPRVPGTRGPGTWAKASSAVSPVAMV